MDYGSKKVAEKPVKLWDKIEVPYDENTWTLFKSMRSKATQIMQLLKSAGIRSFIHGSVARGDVDKYSDIDVILLTVTPTHKIEWAITPYYKIFKRIITQATPSHAIKGHIYLDADEKISITVPLLSLRTLEVQFYKFGGICNLTQTLKEKRVSGFTKKLTFIEPTELGHYEYSINGFEKDIARRLNIDIEIIKERKRVLSRRDVIGRTGVFLNKTLQEDETFEGKLKKIIDSNPAVRRRYLQRR